MMIHSIPAFGSGCADRAAGAVLGPDRIDVDRQSLPDHSESADDRLRVKFTLVT